MTTLDTSNAQAHEALETSRHLVDPALRAAVETLPEDVRHIARYHFGWTDENGRTTTNRGGKALRPALVLLSANAVGASEQTAVPAAVAIELVHNFSLLHDDVLDHDATRRHRPTAWSLFGVSGAILTGDALLSLASGVLAGSDHPQALPAAQCLNTAVQELIRGQLMDLAFEQRNDVDLDECQRMAQAKTAALLECACELGALLGDGSTEQIEQLRHFGHDLGLAFQHVDDYLGVWGSPEITGKPVYSDLRGRKKTLPVVAALQSGTAAGRALAERYLGNGSVHSAELTTIADLIDDAGARSWNDEQADHLLTQALDHLDRVGPPECSTTLRAIAHLAAHRDR